ncbi:serine/threonine-protein kinase [Streptomyces liangshanensis]|uniref:Protein kinase n=1 Tax=Streptomyces liangshanensis TaxID=2717324 RepID=A0A6G9GYJ7_9ACTN|nr:serine/threonine-protein kinase [Streptomyces liangshanensis]QIQ03290.1 protein kinase [Streptomyces liangshanensis]
MQPLEAGEESVGPYRLLGRLGSGGMGRVYLARSTGGRTVAVKVVHPHYAMDEEFRARFRREVASARLVGTGPGAHRWSAPVLAADPDADVPWVATGYVAGPSLTQAVAGHGSLPGRSVTALGAALAEALVAVHGLGLVHRDVKPSNVLLALDGPRLIDFGIARATDGTASLTATGVSVGSPGYMAPEQITGKGVTGAADVFSLGAVLAYAATGAGPFVGDSSAALLYKVVHEEPELGPMEGALRDLVVHCLAKDPAARPTPAEVARRLAPGGAERAVAGGWLPGPLVEEVSLAAVALLDLDVEGRAPGPVPAAEPSAGHSRVATGPVPFTQASTDGGGTDRGDATGSGARAPEPVLGVFGPPTEPPRDAAVPERRSPDGGFSVSVSGNAGRGQGRRGRKVSCTVVLAVAGALAAVTVGGGVLLDQWNDDKRSSAAQDGGQTDTTASAPATSGPPASTPAPGDPAPDTPSGSASPSDSAAPGPGAGAVPDELIGTWDGPITAAGIPAGTMKVTLTKGTAGERVGTGEQTDILGNFTCQDLFTLTRAEDRAIVVDVKKGPRSQSLCTESSEGLRLTLEKDGLHYDSDDAAAGNPTGVLKKR